MSDVECTVCGKPLEECMAIGASCGLAARAAQRAYEGAKRDEARQYTALSQAEARVRELEAGLRCARSYIETGSRWPASDTLTLRGWLGYRLTEIDHVLNERSGPSVGPLQGKTAGVDHSRCPVPCSLECDLATREDGPVKCERCGGEWTHNPECPEMREALTAARASSNPKLDSPRFVSEGHTALASRGYQRVNMPADIGRSIQNEIAAAPLDAPCPSDALLVCPVCDEPIAEDGGLCLGSTPDARYCGRACASRAHARAQRTNDATPETIFNHGLEPGILVRDAETGALGIVAKVRLRGASVTVGKRGKTQYWRDPEVVGRVVPNAPRVDKAKCTCRGTFADACPIHQFVSSEVDRLKGLIHSETLTSMHYCETCEMAYQRPEHAADKSCPYCKLHALEDAALRTDYPKGVGAGYLRERAPLYIPVFRDLMLKLADEIDAAEKAGWKPGDPCSAKAESKP